MDPVTTFGLAAGVLQVLDVGFRAISTFHEINQNGSLAEHRNTKEVTEQLSQTTEYLQSCVHGASASATKHSEEVIDISKKCSATAAEVRCLHLLLANYPRSVF